jgi:hypothetical protein
MDLASKVKMFAARVRSGSVKRMYTLAHDIHDEQGTPTPLVFLDMGWCILRYGIGYQEYRGYNFAGKPANLRRTFMTMNHNVALTREMCDRSLYPLFDDKLEFLKRYSAFAGRDWLDVREAGAEGVAAFCAAHPVIFAKPSDSFGGQGIERFVTADIDDMAAFFARLVENRQFLLEEAITQHPKMDELCSDTINTLRMCTVMVDGAPRHVYTIVRMGLGGSCVDNATSGGIYTWVDPDGVLRYPCFSDKTGFHYTEHPTTGLVFEGFQIPLYRECVEFALRVAEVEPRMGYVGWDVAITPDGPVLVEANIIPGYDMPQNSAWHPGGEGALPMFEKALGRKVPK